MKKLKRILISICVVAMLMGCLSVCAFAEVTGYTNDYLAYVIESNDTMISICKSLGIDFASNYLWIMAVNDIKNFNNIKAGQVVYLPRFDTSKNTNLANELVVGLNPNSQAAKLIAATMPNATAVTTTPTATVTVPVTTTVTTPVAVTTTAVATPVAVATQAGDTIVSYLVNHVMKSGETVGGICAALGVDFSANAEQIKKLSGITSWNNIPVGKVVVIPSLVVPAGSSYTAIVAHRVIAGETVGIICAKFGLDYGKVKEQLKALNNTNNLDVIKAGQIFYVPGPGGGVTTTVATVGTVGTAVATTTGVVTTIEPVQTSKMASGTSAHGSFVLQVNGQTVNAATAGQTVTIVATPEAGYTVNTVTVLKDKGTASVPVNGMSFVMPNSAISVNVTFKKA